MIADAAPFEYHRPANVAEALALLGEFGDDARLIAGGQSLVPRLRARLVQPRHLIDIRRLDALARIREERHALVIGAATTHAEIMDSARIRSRVPMVCEVAELAGDPLVRNVGTLGGNLACAEPAWDWPAVVLALGADIAVASVQGERRIPAASFFRGPYGTALEPAEMITSVRFRIPPLRTGSAYVTEADPETGHARCGVAASLTLDEAGVIGAARIAITAGGKLLVRATSAEEVLRGTRPAAAVIEAAADRVTEEAHDATLRAIAHALDRIL